MSEEVNEPVQVMARFVSGELIRPEVNGFLGDKKYRFG